MEDTHNERTRVREAQSRHILFKKRQQLEKYNQQPTVAKSLYITTDLGQLPFALLIEIA